MVKHADLSQKLELLKSMNIKESSSHIEIVKNEINNENNCQIFESENKILKEELNEKNKVCFCFFLFYFLRFLINIFRL